MIRDQGSGINGRGSGINGRGSGIKGQAGCGDSRIQGVDRLATSDGRGRRNLRTGEKIAADGDLRAWKPASQSRRVDSLLRTLE